MFIIIALPHYCPLLPWEMLASQHLMSDDVFVMSCEASFIFHVSRLSSRQHCQSRHYYYSHPAMTNDNRKNTLYQCFLLISAPLQQTILLLLIGVKIAISAFVGDCGLCWVVIVVSVKILTRYHKDFEARACYWWRHITSSSVSSARSVQCA